MNELDISVRDHAGKPTIFLTGKVTASSLDQLQRICLKSLRQFTRGELVVDMAGITYIDSLSMGRFVAINKVAENEGKKIVLTNQQGPIRNAFKTLHVDKVIEVR
jgi:anti-anti-sigma factor